MSGYELTGLAGKVAVVTGAGRMRSIGRPIAVELARAGCDVAITGTGRPPDRYTEEEQAADWRDIESVADEIRAIGQKAVPIVSDISDPDAVEAMIDQVVRELGRVDILVNNAGYARGNDRVNVVDLDRELWRRIIDTNLTGAFYASQAAGRRLIAQGDGGAIINISSIAGKILPPASAAYAASKAGLQALTVSMAKEVAASQIRVNAICPGLVDTSRLDDMSEEAWNQALARLVPLRTRGSGESIAAMVVFLCSDQGAWITGQLYNVDGGVTHV